MRKSYDISITVGNIDLSPKRPEIPPFQIHRNANMHFVGREETLVELENQLAGADTLAITAIKGMGGIGKTELALQYAVAARKIGKYPGGICWIDVRGKDIADEILGFANNYLGFVPPDNQSLEKKVEICWNLWSQSFRQEKLLVLDDVEAYSQIERYLPPYDPSLKVIITTRLRLEPLNITSLVLEVLSDGDALNLLRAYIGTERVDSDLEYAQKLCEWVGNLPLGLTSIGRYLREFPEDSLEEVLERLQEQGLDDAALQEPEISIGNGETTDDLWRGERRLYENVYAVPSITSGSAMSCEAISFSAKRTTSAESRTITMLSFSSTTTSRTLAMVRTALATLFASALLR